MCEIEMGCLAKAFISLEQENNEETFFTLIAKFIDDANAKNLIEYTERGIALLNGWLPKVTTSKNKVLCHYFLSVAWADKRKYDRHKQVIAWDWEQEEIEQEIINLRFAEKYFNSSEHPEERYCQILTNLANLYDEIGRPIRALAYWNRVIKLNEKFGMAVANKGNCLIYHGLNSLTENHFRLFYVQVGYRDLKVGSQHVHNDAVFNNMETCVNTFESNYGDILKQNIAMPQNPTGLEADYTRWCIKNTLFLNPLLDIYDYSFATYDNPTATLQNDELDNLLDQIKREFRLARNFFSLYC